METLERIRRVSRTMQCLAMMFIVILPAYQIATWFWVDPWLQNSLVARGIHIAPADIGTLKRGLGFLVQTIPLGIFLLVLFWTQQLFSLYQHGQIFAPGPIRKLRDMARALLLFTIINPLCGAILSVLLTMDQPEHVLVLGFRSEEITAIFAGGLLLAISWVMLEAKRLADDNTQFV